MNRPTGENHSRQGNRDGIGRLGTTFLVVIVIMLLPGCNSSRTSPTEAETEQYIEACKQGDVRLVRKLINRRPTLVFAKGYLSSTGLHEAAAKGHNEVVQFLIDNGSDIEAMTSTGDTPLHAAGWGGNKDTAALLISAGAIVDKKDTVLGWIALDLAVAKGDNDLVKFFLAEGADVNSASVERSTPLHGACWAGHTATAELLIAEGADIKARTSDGDTPLHEAAKHGGTAVAELLLAKGAESDARNNESMTPLFLAVLNDLPDVVQFLLSRGAAVNAKLVKEVELAPYHVKTVPAGTTPLGLALLLDRKEVAAILRSKGAR